MFRLLARRKSRPAPTRRRLNFETLETRDCPSAALTLQSFNVTRLQGHAIEVSGMVADKADSLTGIPTIEVRLSGVATGNFVVESDGSFFGLTTTTGFGQIVARAYDSDGFISQPLHHDYQNLPPTVSYQVEQSGPGMFRVFGVVTDEVPNLATVYIGGVASGTVTPTVNGNFSFTFTPPGLGGMNIQAVDSIGQSSILSNFQLNNQPPVIAPFFAVHQGNAWIIQGTVTDEFPTGLVVTFRSSIPSIDGRTATVASNGNFFIVAFLKVGEAGNVSADTNDWFGVASNTAFTWVG